MLGSRPRPPGLLAIAVFAATMHLAAAMVMPVLHAEAEVYQSAREFEASHTARCPRLHAEATCVVGPGFQLVPDPPVSIAEPERDRIATVPVAPELRPQHQRPAGHQVRAPPVQQRQL